MTAGRDGWLVMGRAGHPEDAVRINGLHGRVVRELSRKSRGADAWNASQPDLTLHKWAIAIDPILHPQHSGRALEQRWLHVYGLTTEARREQASFASAVRAAVTLGTWGSAAGEALRKHEAAYALARRPCPPEWSDALGVTSRGPIRLPQGATHSA